MKLVEPDPINIHEHVDAICQLLDIESSYVSELIVTPNNVIAKLYLGKEGRCQGAKYIDPETDQAAMETLAFKVIA